jgi:hypothetical protein
MRSSARRQIKIAKPVMMEGYDAILVAHSAVLVDASLGGLP